MIWNWIDSLLSVLYHGWMGMYDVRAGSKPALWVPMNNQNDQFRVLKMVGVGLVCSHILLLIGLMVLKKMFFGLAMLIVALDVEYICNLFDFKILFGKTSKEAFPTIRSYITCFIIHFVIYLALNVVVMNEFSLR